MIRYYKNVPLKDMFKSNDEYKDFLDYSKRVETFASTSQSANKLIKDELKNHTHNIVLFEYYMVIDGYSYNISPRLFNELSEYMPS